MATATTTARVDWKLIWAQRGFRYFSVAMFVSLFGSGLNFTSQDPDSPKRREELLRRRVARRERRDLAAETLADVPDDEVHQIVELNARKLFRFDG